MRGVVGFQRVRTDPIQGGSKTIDFDFCLSTARTSFDIASDEPGF
jgi:hypothetical protein